LAVSQISPPVRILLIGAVVFLAAWFTVLRPKAEEIPPTTTTTAPPSSTPQTGLGKAVDAAKKAAGQTSETATDSKSEAATTSAPDAKTPNGAITAVPAEALAKLPADVAGALKARKVLVLGVLSSDAKRWRPLPDDDRYVRNALKRVNRYDGKVFVKAVALTELSGYGALVNDLGVNQSPSIVVIDRNLKGSVLSGYVDKVAINQAIADARRNSIEPDIKDEYLRQLNSLCGQYETRVSRWSEPTIRGRKAEVNAVKRRLAIAEQYTRAIARSDAPAKWRGLKAAFVTGMKADVKVLDAYVKATKTGKSADRRAARALYEKNDWTKLDRRFNDVGLTDCAEYRAL
jgi:hypothetical protein